MFSCIKNTFFRKKAASFDVDEIMDSKGDTRLMLSIKNNNRDKFKSLIEKKADVNIADYGGSSPLNAALELYPDETFFTKILLESGADTAFMRWIKYPLELQLALDKSRVKRLSIKNAALLLQYNTKIEKPNQVYKYLMDNYDDSKDFFIALVKLYEIAYKNNTELIKEIQQHAVYKAFSKNLESEIDTATEKGIPKNLLKIIENYSFEPSVVLNK